MLPPSNDTWMSESVGVLDTTSPEMRGHPKFPNDDDIGGRGNKPAQNFGYLMIFLENEKAISFLAG